VRCKAAGVVHYHGFDQIAHMDRTTHRLVCEMGDIHVEGWIPQKLVVDAAVDDPGAEALAACCAAAGCPAECVDVEDVERYDPREREVLGRGKLRHVSRRIRLRCRAPQDKPALYADCLRALLGDQIAWLRDRRHVRRITEDNGLKALAYAEAASQLADIGNGSAV
jgi:hypothetical protein